MTLINPDALDELRDDRMQLGGPALIESKRPLVFPGSFNPFHDGHRRMAKIAEKICSHPADFELSLRNVDKAELPIEEIVRRLGQFGAPDWNNNVVWLTQAPTFAEKARVFPDATFVIGADTAMRLTKLKYYEDKEAVRDLALATLKSHANRFLVFGRLVDNEYRALESMDLPPDWRELCDEVPEDVFRMDISSTELRDQE